MLATMLLQEIADYAAAERTARLPDHVVHHAKRAVLDWFAALLPGTREDAAAALRAAFAEELGRGGAEVYGAGQKAPLRIAALVNGTTSHVAEFDDIFRDGLYHPGCPTIAAALAAAQAKRASGDALLRAVVVGYEVSTRLAAAVVPAHYRFWHTTGTIGTFGAAAAVGTVLGLDAARMAHALASAATMAAGLQQAFRSDAMSKPLHAGHAADAGALAAMLAEQGFTGALDVLEGSAGFGAAMGGEPDWAKATDGFGTRYNITAMTSKNHGCCGHAFAAIDGALALRDRYGLTPDRIRRIRVGTYRTAVEVTGNFEPRTAFEAKFSLAYVVATALLRGSVRLDAFGPERLADPAVRDLMRRIELAIDPELDAQFPNRRAAMVEIETVDGEGLRHLQPTRKGDPEAPLSDAELEAKFFELAAPVIGAPAAAALRDEIAALDRAPRVRLAV
jgi:2-methylcitrate dehydratase PrpD